ncbi:MAG: bifunctional metallophosphatase/5'-nucleotidase [Rubrivivax sp.]|nr:bifunctional metallophosphatase/5'-nucleotidase [Rubrivivax sp.]MDP3610609.1 bifunctional metallophosphatase/5'-nucleotidase [Rubrivivax sp.]
MKKTTGLSLIAAATLLAGCATSTAPTMAVNTEPVKVRVLAINDFHGNLRPPRGGIRIADKANPGKTINVDAGGSEHLATALAQLRLGNPNNVMVAAGDLIGATPLLSALFRDEPTIESLGMMGLEIAAVGNHEFDKGATELLRMQNGGCHPTEGCKGPGTFKGASFQYLAASTVVEKTGKTLLPAYKVKSFQGIPVAFIGLTLEATPSIVVPAGVAGLKFRDEADTVNELVPVLRKQGIEAIVVLIHEGGFATGDYNECPGISGPIVDIVKRLDKAVDLVISGHTHRAYNCRIDGRLVTSADKYGTVVSAIDIEIDPKTRDITSAVADNVIARTSFAKDPRQTALIEQYEKLVVPLAKRVVGRIGAALPRNSNPAGESPLGQVIADAQLAATRAPEDGGAQVAFMNPGGIRADLPMPADGQVRYEDLFSVQPFYNNLVTMTLSGTQLLQLLEAQWLGQPGSGRILHVSRGFTYTWDASKPPGQRVVPGSVRLNGQPVKPGDSVRVTVNSFVAGGGDNFAIFKEGKNVRTGAMDVDALEAYVRNNPTVQPGALDRIVRLN